MTKDPLTPEQRMLLDREQNYREPYRRSAISTATLLEVSRNYESRIAELEAQLAAIREAFLERYQDLKGASP